MTSLAGKVAVVTGASRGIGKGIALGLGEAGATVYVTGRTVEDGSADLPGGVAATAAEVTRLGGVGIAARCDHRNDMEVERLFARIAAEQGRLDLLVNNALGSPPQSVLWGSHKFWEVPIALWDDLIDVGLRSHYVAAWYAVPLMIKAHAGLIVNVASHVSGAGKSSRSRVLMSYSVGKAGLHRLNADMATELREFGIAVVSIWPPATRTEGVLAQKEVFGDLSKWKEPIFTGRVVAALAMSGDLLAQSGEALVVDDLAAKLGVSDARAAPAS
jgi:dehydrogenase/reductase SDR family member 1